jgi:3-phenylpropionate/trans-cinnamate dioxygenase ferredoxin reductase subunit
MPAGTLIIGTGQAGFQTAASLRSEGYQEPIALLGDEPHIPYQRPPLSKAFLMGKESAESIELRPRAFYPDHNIQLLVGERALSIEPSQRRVNLVSGASLPYDKLVLAVGARNRLLPIPGAQLDGVLYLRSLDEAAALKQRLENAREVVVIGGGFIGLEVAAVARCLGKSVTVLEALPRVMSRVVAPAISDFFKRLHTSRDVKIKCSSAIAEIAGSRGKVSGVTLNDATFLPADLVIIGIGVAPNSELARDAGLAVANGISVNENLQTTNESIFAIGDCAEHPNPFASARIRLESVQNAADQAQHVAAQIVGRPGPYRAVPWFWTDQYDIKLQMAGISQGHDRTVTRGNSESNKLSVFYFHQNRLLAIDSINRPLDHMIGRKLIAAGASVTPEQAADESVDLKKLGSALGPHAGHSGNHPN